MPEVRLSVQERSEITRTRQSLLAPKGGGFGGALHRVGLGDKSPDLIMMVEAQSANRPPKDVQKRAGAVMYAHSWLHWLRKLGP